MYSDQDKAEILVDALPYIQEFYGTTVVIKYGGNAMINDALKENVMRDVALMKFVGIRPILVHGGGPEITGFLKKVGKESAFVSGLRVTDEETVEIAEMVLDGKINSDIVTLLNRRGVSAVGLSGKDANLIRAKKKLATVYEGEASRKIDIGYVGQVETIDTRLLRDLIAHDYIPVIAPIGVGADGESYNINADVVAGKIAEVLQAEKLVLLTNTAGVLDKSGRLLTGLTAAQVDALFADGTISGGMLPKISSALDAARSGVKAVHIIDGRVDHCLLLELLTDQGVGTMISSN